MFLKLRPDFAKNDALNIILIAVLLKFLILKKVYLRRSINSHEHCAARKCKRSLQFLKSLSTPAACCFFFCLSFSGHSVPCCLSQPKFFFDPIIKSASGEKARLVLRFSNLRITNVL